MSERYNARGVTALLLPIGVGLVLAMAYTASPLAVVFVAAAPVICVIAGRGMPDDERRVLAAILGAALVARLVVVGASFVAGIPYHSDLVVGALAGDEAYNLSRSLRVRDILMGFGGTRYDYFIVTDFYGRSSYLDLLTWLQMVFGPSPYGLKLLNGLLFTSGAAILFRLVRPAFGSMPAYLGLVLVLFLPTLFHASVALLKESVYFLATSALLTATVLGLRTRRPAAMLGAVAVAAASLWVLDDLRRGAIVLATSGIAAGLLLRFILATRWRIAAATIVLIVAIGAAAWQPAIESRLIGGINNLANTHSGHVFTVGHAYKLLDAGFYVNPTTPAAATFHLTWPQAARFVIRGIASFIFVPLPWQALSLGELAYLPEHLLWFVMLAALPAGLVAGWRRDSLVTVCLIGFILPTVAALALGQGNVGTLIRLRGLVTPYLFWIGALGVWTIAARFARGARGNDADSPRLAAQRTIG